MKNLVLMVLALFFLAGTVNAQDAAKKKANSKLIGWVVADYINDFEDDGTHTFGLKHARLIYKGKMDAVDYHIMGEFAGGAAKLAQAWVGYTFNQNISLRVGQFKTPFGLEYYPSFMVWKFVNPSFITGAIAKGMGRNGGAFREAGAQVTFKYKINDDIGFVGKAFAMNGNGINNRDNNTEKDYVVMGALTLPFNAQVGASYYTGTALVEDPTTNIFHNKGETAMNFHGKMSYEGFTAQAEYMMATYETFGKDEKPAGFYLYGTYLFNKKYELGARYDSMEGNTEVDDTDKSRITVSAGYYLSKTNRILFNYEMNDGKANGRKDAVFVQFYAVIK